MKKRVATTSSVEIQFTPTPDGLVVDRIILRAANAEAETDLRSFLKRFRDPDLDDLQNRICRQGNP